jgi:trehalose 6-phosphate synthase
VSYLHRHLSYDELLAMYAAADVALITPLKDGMNLVAKEFCAARHDEQGVLVLSEFAGAAAELNCGALLVNPYDAEGVASALRQALLMPEEEQRNRMRKMRRVIQSNNVFEWSRSICGHLVGEKPGPQLLVASRDSQSMARAV